MSFENLGTSGLALALAAFASMPAHSQSVRTEIARYEFRNQESLTEGAAPESGGEISVTSVASGKQIFNIKTQLQPNCTNAIQPQVAMIQSRRVVLMCGATGPSQHETLLAFADEAEPRFAALDLLEGKADVRANAAGDIEAVVIRRMHELEKFGRIHVPISFKLTVRDYIFSFERSRKEKVKESAIESHLAGLLQRNPMQEPEKIATYLLINANISPAQVCRQYEKNVALANRLNFNSQIKIKEMLNNQLEVQLCKPTSEELK